MPMPIIQLKRVARAALMASTAWLAASPSAPAQDSTPAKAGPAPAALQK